MPSKEYLDLLEQMADLHRRKSAGYAGADNPDPWANFRRCEQFGISTQDGVITRMSDKWSRLQALWCDAGNEQVGESLDDTLMDLASYALILVCLRKEQRETFTATWPGKDERHPPPDLTGLTYYPENAEHKEPS